MVFESLLLEVAQGGDMPRTDLGVTRSQRGPIEFKALENFNK